MNSGYECPTHRLYWVCSWSSLLSSPIYRDETAGAIGPVHLWFRVVEKHQLYVFFSEALSSDNFFASDWIAAHIILSEKMLILAFDSKCGVTCDSAMQTIHVSNIKALSRQVTLPLAAKD